jgi:antitoxin VapB
VYRCQDNEADRTMALSIKDEETDRAVRELAARTGESITVAVRRSVEERLERERARMGEATLVSELLAMGARFSELPVLDPRPPDDLLYDEHGLPR